MDSSPQFYKHMTEGHKQQLMGKLVGGNSIQPTSSCELASTLQEELRSDVQAGGTLNNIRGSQIFLPLHKMVQEQKEHANQLINIFLKKNEEVASALLKEKKSMSDYVYADATKECLNRYIQLSSCKNTNVNSLRVQRAGGKESVPSLPKLSRYPAISEKDADQKAAENTKKRLNQDCLAEQKVDIEGFMRLQQQAYFPQKINHEAKLKIRKNLPVRKKQMQTSHTSVKDSLRDLLQARIIVKEQSQSLEATDKASENESVLKVLRRQRQRQVALTLVPVSKQMGVLRKQMATKPAEFSHKSLVLDTEATIYERKMKLLREFIFISNLAHSVFDPVLLDGPDCKLKYTYYVGKGNNKELIKALMKRRPWWVEVHTPSSANFLWTQLRDHSYSDVQISSKKNKIDCEESQRYKTEKGSKETKGGLQKEKPELVLPKRTQVYRACLPHCCFDKVLTNAQKEKYQSFLEKASHGANNERFATFESRRKHFPEMTPCTDKSGYRLHNHLENNFYIGNKKALFHHLSKFYSLIHKNVFEVIPLTFHVRGVSDPVYKDFLKSFRHHKFSNVNSKNLWIVKPGENSNRGRGIYVCNQLSAISKIVGRAEDSTCTFIIQKYIERPLLFKGRKFDIRHYILATRMHGRMRLYFYGQGYVRTSSREYDLSEVEDIEVHLTNDAIQKQSTSYGRFEEGNKISYTDLQRYIESVYPKSKFSVVKDLYPTMKQISCDAFKSACLGIDPRRLEHNFEIFGLDFMIDCDFKVWLLEVNTNPCLETGSSLLHRIIPNMLEQSLRLTIDTLFPPTQHYPNSMKHLIPNDPLGRLQFELVFDQGRDRQQLQSIFEGQTIDTHADDLDEDQQTYENDGREAEFEVE